MMTSIERVTAALELREPDRVPTFDVMEEYSNIYDVLGKKPMPLGFLVTNRYASRLYRQLVPPLNRIHVIDWEMDHFSYDRTAAAVKLGYDSAWVMHVPIWRFRTPGSRRTSTAATTTWSWTSGATSGLPCTEAAYTPSPADWDAWDKRDILRLPGEGEQGVLPHPEGLGRQNIHLRQLPLRAVRDHLAADGLRALRRWRSSARRSSSSA